MLASLAAGEASAEELLDIRPHLRNCAGCRATVRALHASRLRRVTALLPLGAVVEPVRGLFERLRGPRGSADVGELHPMQRAEQLDEAFRQLHAVDPELVEGATRASTARLNLRGWVEAALQRLQSSDVALGVHAAASSGGGRVASIAALIGVCVSGVGAGTYCVATALLPDPKPAIRAEAKPSAKRKAAAARACGEAPAEPGEPSGHAHSDAGADARAAPGAHEAVRSEPHASPDLARPGGDPGLLIRTIRRTGPGHPGGSTVDRRK